MPLHSHSRDRRYQLLRELTFYEAHLDLGEHIPADLEQRVNESLFDPINYQNLDPFAEGSLLQRLAGIISKSPEFAASTLPRLISFSAGNLPELGPIWMLLGMEQIPQSLLPQIPDLINKSGDDWLDQLTLLEFAEFKNLTPAIITALYKKNLRYRNREGLSRKDYQIQFMAEVILKTGILPQLPMRELAEFAKKQEIGESRRTDLVGLIYRRFGSRFLSLASNFPTHSLIALVGDGETFPKEIEDRFKKDQVSLPRDLNRCSPDFQSWIVSQIEAKNTNIATAMRYVQTAPPKLIEKILGYIEYQHSYDGDKNYSKQLIQILLNLKFIPPEIQEKIIRSKIWNDGIGPWSDWHLTNPSPLLLETITAGLRIYSLRTFADYLSNVIERQNQFLPEIFQWLEMLSQKNGVSNKDLVTSSARGIYNYLLKLTRSENAEAIQAVRRFILESNSLYLDSFIDLLAEEGSRSPEKLRLPDAIAEALRKRIPTLPVPKQENERKSRNALKKVIGLVDDPISAILEKSFASYFDHHISPLMLRHLYSQIREFHANSSLFRGQLYLLARSEKARNRTDIIEALPILGGDLQPWLRELLPLLATDPDPSVRAAFSETFVRLYEAYPDFRQLLVEWMDHPNPRVRLEMAKLLPKVSRSLTPELRRNLHRLMQDPSPAVREQMASSINILGLPTRECQHAVLSLLYDPFPSVRTMITDTLDSLAELSPEMYEVIGRYLQQSQHKKNALAERSVLGMLYRRAKRLSTDALSAELGEVDPRVLMDIRARLPLGHPMADPISRVTQLGKVRCFLQNVRRPIYRPRNVSGV